MIQFSENPETTEILPTTPVIAADELEQIELETAAEDLPDVRAAKVDSDAEDAALDIEDFDPALPARDRSRAAPDS